MASQLRSFYGCYLLRSLAPAARIRTYIGFTVNPRRRIRQHNGEISMGAWRTKRGRPWEMVLVVYGFPTQVQALQFEWAWQHPELSKIVRPVVAQLKASQRKGLQGKVHILMGMLGASPWCYYPLTLQILSAQHASLLKACASAPPHMPIVEAPMDQLPLPGKQQQQEEEAEEQQQQQQTDSEDSHSDYDSADEAEQTLSQRLALRANSQQQEQQQHKHSGYDSADEAEQTLSQRLALRVHSQQQQQQQQHAQQQPRRRRQKVNNSMLESGYSSGSSGVVLIDDSGGSSDLEPESSGVTQSSSRQPSPVRRALAVVNQAAAAVAGAVLPASKRRGKLIQQAADSSKTGEKLRCGVCQRAMERFVLTCNRCSTEYHTDCLAKALLQQQELPSLRTSSCSSSLPGIGRCLCCGGQLVWQDLLTGMKPFGAAATASQRQPRSRTRKKKGSKARSRSTSKTRKLAASAAAGLNKGTRVKGRSKAAAAAAAGAGTQPAAQASAKASSPKKAKASSPKKAKASSPKKAKASKPKVSKKAASKSTQSDSEAKKISAKVGRPRKSPQGKAGSGATSDSSSSSRCKGKTSRSIRGPVVGAAAAWDVGGSGPAALSSDLPALADLADHLAQQYPDLRLPSDPEQLAALLLGQQMMDAELSTKPMQSSQQHQQQQPPVEQLHGLQQQGYDVHHQQPEQQQHVHPHEPAGSLFLDWLTEQQQQPSQPPDGPTELTDTPGSRCWQRVQQQQQLQLQDGPTDLTDTPGSCCCQRVQQQQPLQLQGGPEDLTDTPGSCYWQRAQQQTAADVLGTAAPAVGAAAIPAESVADDVVDLLDDGQSPSPPPLLARLKLTSPLGKRDRPIDATHDIPTCNAAISSRGSSSVGGSSGDPSQHTAVRRLRLNGTTPVVMAKRKAALPSSVCGAGSREDAGRGRSTYCHVESDVEVECLLDD